MVMDIVNMPFPVWALTLLIVWELVWKGLGLWKSARAKCRVWFIAILILNTAGILPIIYLVFVKPNAWIAKKSGKKGKR